MLQIWEMLKKCFRWLPSIGMKKQYIEMSSFLWLFIDTHVIINMTCCCLVATVFNNAYHHIDVYGDDIEVDYRGYEVGIIEILQIETALLYLTSPFHLYSSLCASSNHDWSMFSVFCHLSCRLVSCHILHQVSPSQLWSACPFRFPSTVICNIFLVASSLSRLWTCPNHLNLFSLRNSAIGYMCASFQMSTFLTWSSLVFPTLLGMHYYVLLYFCDII